MIRRHLLAAAVLASWAPARLRAQTPADTVEVGGIAYDTSVNLGGSRLLLNGAGIRYKFLRVYTAGLYLATKATTLDAVLSAPGPKRMRIVMLRDIDASELGRLFTRGMQDNAPRDEMVKSIPGTIRMGEIFAAKKRLVAGDGFSVDFVPGAGTAVVVNGQPQGEPIREPEFFSALLRIWLGTSPADALLKDLLLGKEPPASRKPGG